MESVEVALLKLLWASFLLFLETPSCLGTKMRGHRQPKRMVRGATRNRIFGREPDVAGLPVGAASVAVSEKKNCMRGEKINLAKLIYLVGVYLLKQRCVVRKLLVGFASYLFGSPRLELFFFRALFLTVSSFPFLGTIPRRIVVAPLLGGFAVVVA